jgi:hypothetical protein
VNVIITPAHARIADIDAHYCIDPLQSCERSHRTKAIMRATQVPPPYGRNHGLAQPRGIA